MRCALIGNPNVGKSYLFNQLTGAHVRVGNWSGVTVDIAEAQTLEHTFIDLPGLYSLKESARLDEQLAQRIMHEGIDVIINVIDCTQLERQLFLTTELLDLSVPMVVMLTMCDKAQNKGIHVDAKQLSLALNCPVVSSKNELLSTLTLPIQAAKPLDSSKYIHAKAHEVLEDEALVSLDARYQAIHQITSAVETKILNKRTSWTQKIDDILLNRLYAIPIFFLVMYLLFFVVIGIGGYAQAQIMVVAESTLEHMPLLKGVGIGVATVCSFVPVMGMMFLLLACLETSGYMNRVAFVTDKLMHYLGLPGKAFVPLVIGFGCNVPAVMAARTLDSESDRKLVMLMSPFMSCSARLTIYTAFVSAFFPTGGYNVVFSLYLIGILVAIMTGVIFRKVLFRGDYAPLLLELPEYEWPNLKRIGYQTIRKLNAFLWRAAKFIVPICFILEILQTVTIAGHESVIVQIGRFIQPLFAPMGIDSDNWQAVVGLMTGIFAKEVVMGTLNTLYQNAFDLRLYFNDLMTVYAYLLFILLYIPCASTMAVIREEAGRQLMWVSIVWSTLLAYGLSTLFYQSATFTQHPEQSLIWIGLIMSVISGFVRFVYYKHRKLLGGQNAVQSS